MVMKCLVCSSDGTVAFFQFEKHEMGDPMSVEDKVCGTCDSAKEKAKKIKLSSINKVSSVYRYRILTYSKVHISIVCFFA